MGSKVLHISKKYVGSEVKKQGNCGRDEWRRHKSSQAEAKTVVKWAGFTQAETTRD